MRFRQNSLISQFVLTALAAKNQLLRYAGSGNDFYDRLSKVLERYVKAGNFRGTKERIYFTVYQDIFGQAVITLPRKFNSVLAGNFFVIGRGGPALKVQDPWYESSREGPGIESNLCVESFIPLEGRFCTFADWTTPMLLRFRFEQSEDAGKIVVRGQLNGETIYSLDGSTWINGIAVNYSGTADVTTTQMFDVPPSRIIKPITKGRVKLYTVDSLSAETLVAVYEPDETLPAWRRYRVPDCTNPSVIMIPSSPQFYTKAEVDSLFGNGGDITVFQNTTIPLLPGRPYVQWDQTIAAQGGVGPYLAKFILDASGFPKIDALFRINVDLVQSGNPTIQIFNPTDNTVIQQIEGDSSNAQNFFFEARWTGLDWIKTQGYFLA